VLPAPSTAMAVADGDEAATDGEGTGDASAGRCGLGAGTAAADADGTAAWVGALAAPPPQATPMTRVKVAHAARATWPHVMRRELRVQRTSASHGSLELGGSISRLLSDR
jgi:hypothetical protein